VAQHEWRASAALSLGGVFAAAGLVLLCALGSQRQRWLGEGGDYSAFLNLALAACLLPFALSTVARRSDAVGRTMGDWSFLLYLFHWPLVIVFRQAGEGRWGVLAAGVPLLTFALYVIWRWYDRSFERLRANWVKSRMLQENEANPAAERKKGDTPPHFA
jgi:peptidoglycan/LPS O-acetylase OafA/YrhL